MSDTEEDRPDYKRLTGKIGGHKGYLTKLGDGIAAFVGVDMLSGEQLIEAKQLQSTIEERIVLLQGFFDDLLGNSNLTQDDIDSFDAYMSGIKKKLASLKFRIETSTNPPVRLETPTSHQSPNQPNPCELAVKYPEIKLPSFSGGVNGTRDFRPFYQIFNSLVSDNEGIPEIYKVQYLRSCLPEGSEAWQLISYIPPTAENFTLHMTTLVSRYGDTSGEANRLRRVLMSISSWQVCNSVESQRKLLEHVRQNLSLLEQLEELSPDDMRCLALDLLAIIPERLRFKVAKLDKEDRTVQRIMNMVEESIKNKLEVKSFSDPAKRQTDTGRRNQQPQRPYTPSHLYHSVNHRKDQHDSRACIYCGDLGHTPHKCTKKPKEERASIVANSRRCWNCLSDSHQVKACKLPSRCQCSSKGKHSHSLCGVTPPWKSRGSGATGRGTVQVVGDIVGTGLFSPTIASARSYLSTLEMELPSRTGGSQKVRLLLDGAATHSYGLERVIDKLQVTDRGGVNITVSSFNGLCDLSTRMVELELPGGISVNLIVSDEICEPLHGHTLDDPLMKKLEEYPLGDPSCVKEKSLPIDILIGVDNKWRLMTDSIVRLRPGLVVMSTLFGWVLSGEVPSKGSRVHGRTYMAHTLLSRSKLYELSAQDSWPQFHALCSMQSKSTDVEFVGPHLHESCSDKSSLDEDLEEVKCELERFWDLDTLGIKLDREISPVLEDFLHTLSQDEVTGRYTVSLPRKRNIVYLPSNYGPSVRRLKSLWDRFERPGNEDFASKYRAIIKDQLEQGIIEEVTLPQAERERLEKFTSVCCGSFYIPHHGVLKKDKVRVVYDGSAFAYKGALSLNQCLLVGPSLVNLLVEVLLTFRLHSVVLLADITKAFLNVGVAEADRDLLRFLWFDEDGNLQVYRFTRVPFGTGPSPFLLNATLKHHFEKVVKDQTLLALLLRSIYVDDILTGGKTSEIVIQLKDELEKILGQAAMKLHGFDSNSPDVREAMGVEEQPDDKVLLGVCWNRRRDDMGINLERILGHSKGASSKRELLRGTSKFFDPHGIYSPVLLVPKLMFQKVCSRKFSWDDPLPDDLAKCWMEWRDELPLLEEVRVQRHALLPNHDRLELHGFSDASQSAYAATIYIKSSCGEESTCHLIMCKNRVAPQKKLTIPRLELMGALLLARLMAVVVAFLKHLKIDSIVYYTDSMNVLYWIRTEHRMWAVFVACRIKEINSLSNFADWKYVRTDLNPADLATRGLKPSELLNNKLWFHGPDFIVTGRSDPDVDSFHPPAACLQESKKAVHVVVPVRTGVGSVIKSDDFSCLHRLLARTVLYLRFVYWLAKKFGRDPGTRFDFSLSELYGQARQLWVKFVQMENYAVELQFCRNNPARIPAGMRVPTSLLKQLDLRLDQQGILRVGTRLLNADIPDSMKFPVLLPKDSHFTQLVITATHQRLCHAGVRQVMSSIRGWYWIPHCRRTIGKIVRSCVNCRKVMADFYPVPDPPPLPDFRVAQVDAFDNIGIDHCGPLYFREGRGKPQKCYVLILTCAVTRGLCLELVLDMSVHHFMLGFRRFVSDFGLPAYIMSDNGKSFECAGRELQAILNHPRFQKYLGGRNIRWDHYLEYSPQWGGWIEKLNHSFKSAIRKVLGGTCVTFMELYTLLKEIQAVMNSRPISYVYDGINEGRAITPSMLHCGKNLTQLPPNMFDYKFDRKNPMTCRERLKHLEKVKTYFRTRWTKEYLAELTEKHANIRRGKPVRQPQVGDIVLVKDGSQTLVKIPRCKWPLGRIVKVHPGRDGLVRSVDLYMTVDKGEQPCVLRHKSPRQLVPLECEEFDQ